jgi:hypothetical protein
MNMEARGSSKILVHISALKIEAGNFGIYIPNHYSRVIVVSLALCEVFTLLAK